MRNLSLLTVDARKVGFSSIPASRLCLDSVSRLTYIATYEEGIVTVYAIAVRILNDLVIVCITEI
jgi:serine protease inhibitor